METPRNRYARDSIDRSLSRASDQNRPLLVQYLEFKRAGGVRLTTLKLYAGWIQRFDESLGGKSFATAAPEDVGPPREGERGYPRTFGRPELHG